MTTIIIRTPAPPCDSCRGACCIAPKGAKTLAALNPEEVPHFPEAIRRKDGEMALPVKADGRCVHLGDDNQCQIYDQRPQVCRQFNCLHGYCLGRNRHGFFLQDHPEIVELIELQYPDFVARKIQEQYARPVI